MKKLKRILATLLVFTMIFSVPMFTFAADGDEAEVETKYGYLKSNNSGTTNGFLNYEANTYYNTANNSGRERYIGIYQGFTNDYTYNPSYYYIGGDKGLILTKIDLDSENLGSYKTKDIQNVYLLVKNNASKEAYLGTTKTITISNVLTDWEVGVGATLPSVGDSKTYSFSFVAPTEGQDAVKGYPAISNFEPFKNDTANYESLKTFDQAADITDFIKDNLENGENETKLMIDSNSNYTITTLALYFVYKDNTKPEVVVNRTSGENSVVFNGTVTDADGITSATYAVDGGEAFNLELTDGAYSVSVDTTSLQEGEHTFTITATDSLGAVTKLNSKFKVVAKKYAILKANKDGDQEGFLTYEYSNVTNVDKGTKAGLYNGYTDDRTYSGSYFRIEGENRRALMKIDMNSENLGSYKTKDIEKIELLFTTNSNDYVGSTKNIKVANVTSDWTVGEGVALPSYDEEGATTTAFEFVEATEGQTKVRVYPALCNFEGYTDDTATYDHAINITSFVKNNLNNGIDETKLMVYSANNYVFTNLALYITYKDNNKPTITVNQNTENSIVTISGTILDEDGDKITSATHSLPGAQATNLTLENGAFSFDFDMSGLKQDAYTITITAQDEYGAQSIRNINIIKQYGLEITDASYVKVEGGYTISASLASLTSEEVDGYVLYALYNEQNVLLAANMEALDATSNSLNKLVAYSGSDTVSYGKIFVWDSLTGIVPLTSATTVYDTVAQ